MFLINLNIGVVKIFDWGEGAQICNEYAIRNFRKNFIGVKDTVELGSGAGAWAARNRDFAKGENLNPKLIFCIKNV